MTQAYGPHAPSAEAPGDPPGPSPEPTRPASPPAISASGDAGCPTGSRRAPLLVFLFGLALYIGTVEYDFVWDDHTQFQNNQYITQARYLPRFFTDDLAQITSGVMIAPYYRPLLWASLLCDFLVWGIRPAGFHFTNALWYALACLLVFRLARVLLGDDEPALLAALLFAAHPSHVETIAMASGRIEAMATIGVLLAVLGYHRARLAVGWRGSLAALGGLAAFVFGLLSKETALSLPLILAWYEVTVWREGACEDRGRIAGVVARLAPYFVVALGLLWFRWHAVAQWMSSIAGAWAPVQRVPGSLELVARYARLAVLPIRLQPVYFLPRPTSLLSPWPLAGLGLLILAGGLAAWWRWRRPVASFGLGWFFLALGPVLDIVPVSGRPMNFATRYLFISTIGLSLLAGAGLARLLAVPAGPPGAVRPEADRSRARRRWVAIAASALVIVGWSARSLTYLPVFRNDLQLFARVAREVPEMAQGHQNLGLALLKAGRPKDAMLALERAVAAEPTLGSARLALAYAYVANGRPAEGFRLLDEVSRRIGEEYGYVRTRAAAHLFRAEWRAAVEVLTRGLRRYPDAGEFHLFLGYAWEGLDDLPRAEAAYRRALALYPDVTGGRLSLAHLLVRAGRPAEGAALARAALRLEPDSSEAWRAVALALEASGDRSGSRQAWQRVLELDQAPEARAEARRHLSAPGTPASSPAPRDR